MTSFDFLQTEKDFSSFSVPAIAAERILHIAPAACVLNCRRAMEFAVKWMYSVDKQLVTSYDSRLASLLSGEDFRDIVGPDLWRRMDLILKLGNHAAHAGMVRKARELNRENFAKLKGNVPLTQGDVQALEKILWSEVGTRQDYEAACGQKPLGEFVREIVGLDMSAAKDAFAEYWNDTSLDSRQIYFVNRIVEYIVHNGVLKDMSVFQGPPFTDRGSVVDIFTDMTIWLGIRAVIDRINVNAAAA